jgi:hypothetical protein
MKSRSGLVVKFVLAMHEPRVRFTAATIVLRAFGQKSVRPTCTRLDEAYNFWSPVTTGNVSQCSRPQRRPLSYHRTSISLMLMPADPIPAMRFRHD